MDHGRSRRRRVCGVGGVRTAAEAGWPDISVWRSGQSRGLKLLGPQRHCAITSPLLRLRGRVAMSDHLASQKEKIPALPLAQKQLPLDLDPTVPWQQFRAISLTAREPKPANCHGQASATIATRQARAHRHRHAMRRTAHRGVRRRRRQCQAKARS